MELMNFNYNDHEVRAVTVEGEPGFIAADICRVLGIGNPSQALSYLDEDERGLISNETPSGVQAMAFVTESGLYSLILRSRKPEAKPFKRWVTHEVLPSIRKHGGYLTPAKVEEFLTDPDTIIQLATNLKEERAARVRAEKAQEAITSYARELEPKADNYDRFISGDGTYSVGTVAKMLGQSQNKLFTLLRNAGIFISKGPMRNTPYQQYMHHFAVKACDFHRSDDTTGTSYTTRVQPSGVDFVARKLGLQVADMAA